MAGFLSLRQEFIASLPSSSLIQKCHSCLKCVERGSESSGEFYDPCLPSLFFYWQHLQVFFHTRMTWEELQTIQAQKQTEANL